MNKTLAEDIRMLADQYGGVGELRGGSELHVVGSGILAHEAQGLNLAAVVGEIARDGLSCL